MLVFDTTSSQHRPRLDTGKKDLDRLQTLVGGNIELLPHRQGYEAPWTAYANEEGMNEGLPSNFLAWGVLRHLGFVDSSMGLCFYFGNVVLLGRGGGALTAKQIEKVETARKAYLKEMGE